MWLRAVADGGGCPGDIVYLDDPTELGFRCRRWNVPPEAVAKAVRKVGSDAAAVARELGMPPPRVG